ncbi:6-bladed beta-propeller [Arenibacter algicola]|uniref:6-bladed beta-propeller n=1 Tax=Arenibacter algicola TaxID=616991 RepID=UPI001C07585B|nr:6-bladed beta-propeller [Arenibacter algicola]MBU2903440.1 6-bladed beta-propeller [Arenibacter algicola]
MKSTIKSQALMCLINYRVIIYLIVLSGLIGCNSDESAKNKIKSLKINPYNKLVECNLSDITSNLDTIFLETKRESLIGLFSSLVYLDKEIIIYKSEEKIIIFDGKGKYKNQIDASGKGPGEYTTILKVFVDNSRNWIHIVDIAGILIYNFEGSYIKTIETGFRPAGLYKNKEDNFIVPIIQNYNEEDREMLNIYDSSFTRISSFKSKNPDKYSNLEQHIFQVGNPYGFDNKVFYKEPFVDTIYQVYDTILKPHIVLNLGDNKMSTAEGVNILQNNEAKNKIHLSDMYESENYFFLTYYFNESTFFTVFNKANEKVIGHIKYTQEDYKLDNGRVRFGIHNDYFKNTLAFRPNYINDDQIVCVVSPAYLDVEELKSLDCEMNDNPILFVALLK